MVSALNVYMDDALRGRGSPRASTRWSRLMSSASKPLQIASSRLGVVDSLFPFNGFRFMLFLPFEVLSSTPTLD